MENLIGKKIRGFKYSNKIGYADSMDKFIGEIGIVYWQNNSEIGVGFKNYVFEYPIKEAIKHILPEETPQERVNRLEKELEQAKRELKTEVKVWLLVCKRSDDGEIYTNSYYEQSSIPFVAIGEIDESGDLILDIIEREYSI